MAKAAKIFRLGYGVLDKLGFFSPTEKAIDLLGQEKFPAKDLYRLEEGKPAGLLSKFGRSVQDEMIFTGLEEKILGLPKDATIKSQDLKDYLAENKTRVEEVLRTEKPQGQDTIYEPFELSIIEPVRVDKLSGTGRGRYGVQSFLNDIDDELPSALEAFAELDVDSSGADRTRLGTLKNPFINKINYEDLSTKFQTEIVEPYAVEARKDGISYPDDYALAQVDGDTQNLVKFEFSPATDKDKGITYKIQGNNTVGFEILDEDVNIGIASSFNEAKLQLDGHRRRINKIDDSKLKPQHKNYTLPGGTNYQELILKMPDPTDRVIDTLGKYEDVVFEDRFGAIINLKLITGSPSDTTLDTSVAKNLKAGNKVTIDTNKGTRTIRLNKDTNEIELFKPDFYAHSHTGDEENVVVFTRTKDRVDEDGRKILYVEEIQSDMSQRGRVQGVLMGQKEKKAFINRNNKAVFGDVLDSINKLKETTNINDLRGIRASTDTTRNTSLGSFQPTLQVVGFENGFEDLLSVNYGNAHTFEDIIKKHMTKYKFNELKSNQVKKLTNVGIDKINAKNLDPKILEDEAIVIPSNLYTDVTDFVDVNRFQEKIRSIRNVLANKIYTRDIKDKPFRMFEDGKGDNTEKAKFFNDMLKKLMQKDKYNAFIKKERQRTVTDVLPFYITETPNDMGVLEYYNSIGDDDFIDVIPDSELIDNRYDTPRDKLGGIDEDRITKAEFNKKFLDTDMNKKIENKLINIVGLGDTAKKEAKAFDFAEDKLDEVYKDITDLDENLEKAVKYDVKIRPISNIPSAPFIGSTERFTELAIKRLMKHAKDNDYDGISFSSGKIHEKRWNQPTLKQYYDVIIPKVAKNLLKGTDAKLEYTDIFLDQDSLDEATDLIRNNKRYDYVDRDVNTELDRRDPLLGQNDGFRGYIGDTPTIYLTPQVKEYVDSGISLYSPIVATGIAGAVANKMIGSEEDIIRDEGI